MTKSTLSSPPAPFRKRSASAPAPAAGRRRTPRKHLLPERGRSVGLA